MTRTLGSTKPEADKDEKSCGRREGQVSRSRSGLEISDSSVGESFPTAFPTLKLKGTERGGRGDLDPRAAVLGAGRCWDGGLDAEQRPPVSPPQEQRPYGSCSERTVLYV